MILKVWGDWDLFQTLLSTLRAIGDRHGGLSIANVATRWVLDHKFVGAVIIGESVCLSVYPTTVLISRLTFVTSRVIAFPPHPHLTHLTHLTRLTISLSPPPAIYPAFSLKNTR